MVLHEVEHTEQAVPMNFLEQLKLQALRRYEEEKRLYGGELDDHVLALEAVVAHSSDGILLTDASVLDGRDIRIQYLNPAFTNLFGHTAEDLVGKAFHAIFGGSTDTDFSMAETIQKSFSEAIPGILKTRCFKKDGSTFPAEIRLSSVLDGRKRPFKWLFMFRNISDYQEAAETAERLQVIEVEREQLFSELKERKSLEAQLNLGALHDALTGLKNRSYLLERLNESLERASADSLYKGVVACVGLDDFKSITDRMGHRAGDRVLIEIGRRLENCCRPQDTVARLNDDEFAIYLDDINLMEGFEICQKILNTVRPPLLLDGTSKLTASIGFCVLDAQYQSGVDILRDADTSMYRAKRQGGAKCICLDDALNAKAVAFNKSRYELERAIREDQFELHYQPLLDILPTPPRLCAAEALVRWKHPTLGLLLPDKFIPLAEKTGLIVSLGMLVIRKACTQMKHWQSNVLHPDFMLSVNVSDKQLDDSNFFSDLVDVLADTEIDAHVLQLEVSEKALDVSSGRAAATLKRIRQLGVRVTLDNFGTGESSITRLESHTMDSLKFDRSLISRVGSSGKKDELVKFIIDYARAIGIRSIAQGVETDLQGEAIKNYGCTLVQGNIYSAAVPAAEIEKLLDQGTRTLVEH
jgi:diguanylate cyclase (GGDEF)-like protein/PAS domain S-box-containing protein